MFQCGDIGCCIGCCIGCWCCGIGGSIAAELGLNGSAAELSCGFGGAAGGGAGAGAGGGAGATCIGGLDAGIPTLIGKVGP